MARLPRFFRLRSESSWALVAMMVLACSKDGDGTVGGVNADGGSDSAAGGTIGGSALFDLPACRTTFPAQACDGDPLGKWTLAGMCVNRYENCPGAVVKPTGTATATIDFQDGSPQAYFEYAFDFDIETRLSVPASCLGGASCESIGCFAGEDPCSCVYGSGRGGSIRAEWTPNFGGQTTITYSEGGQKRTLKFCAGATTADSSIGGTRVQWNRVCAENNDCRPSNRCHIGKAHCGAGSITCEDTGANRQVGAACGLDQVCDAAGACVACAAGAACQLPNQPCKTGIISCRTALPVCVASGNVVDGTACGNQRQCLDGVCKTDDGAACTTEAECRESCTCGDAQCATRFCGRACSCRFAPAGGACGAPLVDGTSDPGSCKKACFAGRCLTEVGQICATNNECGSGNCVCWRANCSGGRLCSKVACPCQWASSGADTCSGPLMDGYEDFTCRSPMMCIQGACQ